MSDTSATQGGPLSGYKIIEIAGIGPSPLCCSLLADTDDFRTHIREQ